MSTDERLYQFATYHLGKVEKFRDAIPPFEEISREDLVLAALVVFYHQNASAKETVYGMQKLGVNLDEMEEAIFFLAKEKAQLN